MTEKKVCHAASLAIRYYVKDGWTIEELRECLVRGDFHFPFPDDKDPYFLLKQGGAIDVDKMLEKISGILRHFYEQFDKTDKELLESFNW
jgi:hypothetical protein